MRTSVSKTLWDVEWLIGVSHLGLYFLADIRNVTGGAQFQREHFRARTVPIAEAAGWLKPYATKISFEMASNGAKRAPDYPRPSAAIWTCESGKS